jgi:hypothetical protein
MNPARRQRLAEAYRALAAATARVVALQPAVVPPEDMQILADRFAELHGDTPRVTAARRRQIA